MEGTSPSVLFILTVHARHTLSKVNFDTISVINAKSRTSDRKGRALQWDLRNVLSLQDTIEEALLSFQSLNTGQALKIYRLSFTKVCESNRLSGVKPQKIQSLVFASPRQAEANTRQHANERYFLF